MFKIACHVGKSLKTGQAIHRREMLQYARFLVDVVVNQAFPGQVSFNTEKNELTQVKIVYE